MPHADEPNKLWLTDITEFAIPAGKVYLSPIVDCFDGMLVTWTIGTSPNANLVNSMLDSAIKTLDKNEHPIVHSDYAEFRIIATAVFSILTRFFKRNFQIRGCSNQYLE